jgi:hypothetical protein
MTLPLQARLTAVVGQARLTIVVGQAGRLPSSEGSCQGQASLPEADKLAASMIE